VRTQLLVVTPIVLVVLAPDLGLSSGSIDEPFRIMQPNDAIAWSVAILGLNLAIGVRASSHSVSRRSSGSAPTRR
jgi:hypothetical protein